MPRNEKNKIPCRGPLQIIDEIRFEQEPHQQTGIYDQMSPLEKDRPLSSVPLPCGFTLSSEMWLQGKSEAPDETALSKPDSDKPVLASAEQPVSVTREPINLIGLPFFLCGTAQEANTESEDESETEDFGLCPEDIFRTPCEEDDAAVATFSKREHMAFWHMLRGNANPEIAKWMQSELAKFLTHRESDEYVRHRGLASASDEYMMYVASAPAVGVPPDLVKRARREAQEDADEKVHSAIESIMYAQEILLNCGGAGIGDLQHAMMLLTPHTNPLAQGAAQAQELIHQVLLNCPGHAWKAMKKANNHVKDIVMLRCRAESTNLMSREEFLGSVAAAYGVKELDTEKRRQLLLAYQKDKKNQKFGFASNNQIAAKRRGGPRPRRRNRQEHDENEEYSYAGNAWADAIGHQEYQWQ